MFHPPFLSGFLAEYLYTVIILIAVPHLTCDNVSPLPELATFS